MKYDWIIEKSACQENWSFVGKNVGWTIGHKNVENNFSKIFFVPKINEKSLTNSIL